MHRQENLPHREPGSDQSRKQQFREKRTKTDARRRMQRMIAVPKLGMGRPATGELFLGC